MGVYVKGMKMPKEPDEMIELAIFGDGKTLKTGESWRSPVDGKCYYGPSEDMNTYSAFTVHPHGRLIDADALRAKMYHEAFETDTPMQKWDSGCWIRYKMFEKTEESAPTIIPSSEEGE